MDCQFGDRKPSSFETRVHSRVGSPGTELEFAL